MIYVLLALMLFVVAALVLIPSRDKKEAAADPLDFYKAQLSDLDADIAAGKLSEADAASTRVEIQRRILRQSRKQKGVINLATNKGLYLGLALAIGAGSVGGYLNLGSPDTVSSPTSISAMDNAVIGEDGMTLADALDASYQELEANPDNQEMRWRLANALSTLTRHGEAARHFKDGADREPDNALWRVRLGEEIMRMHRGQVVPASMLAFQSALNIEANHPAALYYIGVGYVQGGNEDIALEIFQNIKANSIDGAPWLPMVNEQIAQITGEAGDATDSLRAMGDNDQRAMIESMVTGLEERLIHDPSDAQGWVMLARSKEVLEGKEAAKAVLEDALIKVSEADKPTIQAALDKLK